jgi:hypothetical protein
MQPSAQLCVAIIKLHFGDIPSKVPLAPNAAPFSKCNVFTVQVAYSLLLSGPQTLQQIET